MHKWGGNYNCDYCPKHELRINARVCTIYNIKLKRGRTPGVWVLPCNKCHKNKTYGGIQKG